MIRIGMIGAGRIAGRFVQEAAAVKGISVDTVCALHRSSAQAFAEKGRISQYTNRPEDFFGCVDAVYIASPHETHYKFAKMMLERGIHVLCEKPMALREAEAIELFELAKKKNCVLMEGLKTAYCPGFLALVELAESGVIGQVREVEACFTKLIPTNTRELLNDSCGGSFTELGSYALLPIIKLLGTDYQKVSWRFQTIGNGLDGYAKAELSYGQSWGEAKTGLLVKSEGQLVVSGTKGYILVKSPWWLTKEFQVCFENPVANRIYRYEYEDAGLRYEIEAFVKAIGGEDPVLLSPKESICMAKIMEDCQKSRNRYVNEKKTENQQTLTEIRIWAHRGMSFTYPENTLDAFRAAAELEGLTGIELDVQMTRDGELVVIHDESVERTTDGTGFVKDYDLKALKCLHINTQNQKVTTIPMLCEVLDLLKPYCVGKGLMINLELKNSKVRYEGMEEKILAMVKSWGLESYVWYSSFLLESMGIVKALASDARTGILAVSLEDCIAYAETYGADALHPYVGGLNVVVPERLKGLPVRAWNSGEPFYGQSDIFMEEALERYMQYGITDVFTNVPERYLRHGSKNKMDSMVMKGSKYEKCNGH